ncbi:MAG: MarR family transcriptional regulator, partial [Alphaproteobacteria bacterium]|nr:MarR family transcriptional regulator [Alphaproteobacteria bacterium]
MRAGQESHRAGAAVHLGPLGDLIGFHLRRAQTASFQAFARRVGRTDLSPGTFALLTLIQHNPGISQTALSHADGRDKSSLTPALNALARRGLILRQRLPRNRRTYALSLTPAGGRVLAALAEGGVPGFAVAAWYAVLAPKGTPKPIVDKLSKAIADAVNSPDVKQRLATLGNVSVGSNPADTKAYIA